MDQGSAARRAGLIALAAFAMMGAAGCSRSNGTGAASGSAQGGAAYGGGQAYASDRGSRGGAGGGYGGGYGGGEDRAPVPMFHGEPMWSENRSHSAKENAEYHFERAGADMGSKTLDDFLTKVHRFGDRPPAGTLKLVRANGDRLQYDPKANLFAVFTREGAPRTVFKPSNGLDYWTQQKAREQADASGGGGYRRRSYGGGYGGYGRAEGGGPSAGDQGQ